MAERSPPIIAEEPPPGDVALPAEEPVPEGAPPASVAARGGWRQELLGAEFTILLVSAWLIVSPLVIDYGEGQDAWVPVAGGAIAAALAIFRITGGWLNRPLGVLTVFVGVALLVSSPWVEAPVAGQWNQGLVGAIVIVLALIGLAGTQRGRELHPDET
jgi:hypothetical protein